MPGRRLAALRDRQPGHRRRARLCPWQHFYAHRNAGRIRCTGRTGAGYPKARFIISTSGAAIASLYLVPVTRQMEVYMNKTLKWTMVLSVSLGFAAQPALAQGKGKDKDNKQEHGQAAKGGAQ